jgi:hypothetical protein
MLFKIRFVTKQADVEDLVLCRTIKVNLIVVTAREYPINRFANLYPVYESLIHVTVYKIQFVNHKKHYFSVTKTSRLMLFS